MDVSQHASVCLRSTRILHYKSIISLSYCKIIGLCCLINWDNYIFSFCENIAKYGLRFDNAVGRSVYNMEVNIGLCHLTKFK